MSGGPTNVVEAAIATPELSILVEAVVAAGLEGGALADPDAAITVLAPTNTAFLDLLDTLGVENLEDIDVDTLTTVLTYHVLPEMYMTFDLFDGQNLTTLEGASIFVDLTENATILDGVGSDATIVIPNVMVGALSLIHI